MRKKLFAVLLAVCALWGCLMPAAAQAPSGKIVVRLKSDIAGCTSDDVEALLEILSDNVVCSQRGDGPVSFADYSGTMERCEVVAGRTYTAYYSFAPAEGCTLPDPLEDGDVEIECGKGVRVISTQIVTSGRRDEDYRELRIFAEVVVDGNLFQRIIGLITDWILKARAWSLY